MPLRKQCSKYRILNQIGHGQFGRVFCGLDRDTGKFVALKVLNSQRLPTAQFLHELRLLTSMQHPNIVTFYGLEYSSIGRYLVMDYCEAGTLRQVMNSVGKLSLNQGLKLMTDILLGLHHAHTQGIIHRDLKPENILLTVAPIGWNAHISDFGIAQSTEDFPCEGTGLGDTGSPAYMAPEQFYGRYSYACDLYAMGVLLFELVVGQRPFSGTPGALMQAHLTQPVVIPDTVPFLLRSVIRTALQKLPQHRFTSAGSMLQSVRLAAEVLAATQSSCSVLSISPVAHAQCLIGELHPEPLPAPIHCMTIDGQQVYWAMGSTVYRRTYADGSLRGKIVQEQTMQLDAPVVHIQPCSQGCYVFTHSLQASGSEFCLYCLPFPQQLCDGERDIACSHLPDRHPKASWLLKSWQVQDLVAAIDPQGRWLAIADPNPNFSTPASAPDQPAHTGSPVQILKLPGLQPIQTSMSGPQPTQLLALDHRHGLSIFAGPETASTHTLRLFNRRGNYTDYFHFPFTIQKVTVSATLPYRLFAIEQGESMLGLLIDLQPFKITRIALPMRPTVVVPTDWGYVLADHTQQIVLLDQEGSILSQFELPDIASARITAISPFAESNLMVVTRSHRQSKVYRLDLQHLW